MEVIIRNMRMSDASKIAKYDLVMLGESIGENTIKQHLTDNMLMKYFVMETKLDKEFIGQVSLWIDEEKAQINNFYIIKNFQGKKLGRKFMNYIIKYFNSIKIKEVTLEVRKSNIIAIKLYESCGFRQISIRNRYYSNGEDALLMYMKIGSD